MSFSLIFKEKYTDRKSMPSAWGNISKIPIESSQTGRHIKSSYSFWAIFVQFFCFSNIGRKNNCQKKRQTAAVCLNTIFILNFHFALDIPIIISYYDEIRQLTQRKSICQTLCKASIFRHGDIAIQVARAADGTAEGSQAQRETA